jgi:predicted lysophospholipase L1 biosynthesis ABC-type transport system permease subunit
LHLNHIVDHPHCWRVGAPGSLVGRKLTSQLGKNALTIVGVARTEHYRGPVNARPMPQVFLLHEQRPFSYMTFVARVEGHPDDYLAAGRDVVQSVDRDVPVFGVSTLRDRLNENIARPRFYTAVVVFFGVFALLLSIVGIYGVSSYSITQRAHEIGVRIAVGASARGIRAMLMRQSLAPVGVGTVVEVGAAALTGRFLEHLLSNVQRVGVVTCASAALLLALVAAAAVWSAIERAIRANPLEALRAE